MQDAAKQIKKELGNDAVILHSKQVKKRKWLGLRSQQAVEVIAVLDRDVRASLPSSFLICFAASCIEAAVNFFIFIKYPPLQCSVLQHLLPAHYKKEPEDQGNTVLTAVLHTLLSIRQESAILLCSPAVRMYVKQLLERYFPDLPVLSYNELEANVEVQSNRKIREIPF